MFFKSKPCGTFCECHFLSSPIFRNGNFISCIHTFYSLKVSKNIQVSLTYKKLDKANKTTITECTLDVLTCCAMLTLTYCNCISEIEVLRAQSREICCRWYKASTDFLLNLCLNQCHIIMLTTYKLFVQATMSSFSIFNFWSHHSETLFLRQSLTGLPSPAEPVPNLMKR